MILKFQEKESKRNGKALDIEKRDKTQNIPIKTRVYVDNFLRQIKASLSIKKDKNNRIKQGKI